MKSIEVKFGIGDIVCPVYDAENGKVERMAVKVIEIKKGKRFYQTDNGNYYREEQLVSEAEAFDLAVAYHKRQAEMLIEAATEKLCRVAEVEELVQQAED
jgi:hypothetical protein